MKKIQLKLLLLFAFSMLSQSFFSQDILWEKSYGGKHAEYLMDVQPTADYGFILAGSSLSVKSGNKTQGNNGDLDYWVWKMNEDGDLDWQKNMGGNGSDFLQSIDLTNDGGFILGGVSASGKSFDKLEESIGQDDFWIVKLNAKGEEQWQKTIGGSGQEKLHSIKQTKDGGYILGGTSSSDVSGNKTQDSFGGLDCWIVKLDKDGKIQWQKTIGGDYVDELRCIEPTFDGGFIVGAYSNSPESGLKTNSNKGIGDYWILKLDKEGTIEWQKTIGGDKDDHLYTIHQAYDGNYIVGGNSNSSASFDKSRGNSNGTDFWVLKLDGKGEILWQKNYDFGKVDVLTSLVENEDHSFLIGGYVKGSVKMEDGRGKFGVGRGKTETGVDDYIALKIDENGEELWDRIVGSNGDDVLKKVIETRDGGYIMAGTSNPYPTVLKTAATNTSALSNYTENNQQVEKLNNEVKTAINDTKDDINKEIKDTTDGLTKKANDALGLKEDSSLKLASGDGNGLNLGSLAGGQGANAGLPEKKLPPSRDKKNNLGGNDFWVVKLKDEKKPEKEKA
ncbi:hypothetical protein, partial [Flavobacterium sp.]|uniref:hypothetical protein n=1 Tax=Flavobacterium sp. TaxID=239 RepID=UPI0026263E36